MKAKGYLLAVVAAVTYGVIPLFILPIKAAHFSMDVTLFYRFFISAVFILAILFYKKESLLINWRELMIYIVIGVLFALSSDLLFIAYDYLSAGIASSILFIYPVIVAMLMALFFREKITRITALSLMISLAGIYLLSTNGSLLKINFAGLSISMLSALSYAAYIVIVNKAKLTGSGLKTTFYSLFFSAVFYFFKTLFSGESLLLPNIDLLYDITLFGLITSVISVTALVYAIKLIGSTPTSIMGALEPVVAVSISVLLFSEKLSPVLICGIILILTGVIINIIADSRRVHY